MQQDKRRAAQGEGGPSQGGPRASTWDWGVPPGKSDQWRDRRLSGRTLNFTPDNP
jgi:hypothetical protein